MSEPSWKALKTKLVNGESSVGGPFSKKGPRMSLTQEYGKRRMSQTFSQFCSNQRARIRSRSCFSAGKLDMAMNHNNRLELDLYDGPIDRRELDLEYRRGLIVAKPKV